MQHISSLLCPNDTIHICSFSSVPSPFVISVGHGGAFQIPIMFPDAKVASWMLLKHSEGQNWDRASSKGAAHGVT
jgi:hypothetical protein